LGKTGEVLGVICPTTEAKYFCEGGLDDPNHVESFEQIKVYAHAISEACGRVTEVAPSEMIR
jgi:hypothetical protein